MKKIILALIVIVAFAAVWWNKTPPAAPIAKKNVEKSVPSPDEILASDYEKISKNLKPENTSSEEWKQINSYSLSPVSIVNKDNAKGFFKVASANIPDIYSCLKKDFCGMETRGPDDAYFDDERTPAHILINRNLKIIKESLTQDPSLKSQVNWDLMRDLANSNSEMLSVEALDIIGEFDTANGKSDELVKLTQDYKGTAKAEALARIAKNSSDKKAVANDIEEVFAMGDANTVISVLEKVKSMNFNESERPKILKNLCRFKNMENEAHNWAMIKSLAKKIYSDFEKSCN